MSCMKRVWRRLFGNKPMRVLLLGLDAAGKTTILYQLMGRGENTVPTIGFNVETIKVPPLEFLVWDVSGQERLRSFWRHYYHGTTGIVFVVDSHDVERLPLARKELHGILREEELQQAVLLIIANKVDLPRAVSTEQLSAALELGSLGDRVLHVQPAVAQQGKGLREGLMWLAKAMKEQSRRQEQQQQRGGTAGAAPASALSSAAPSSSAAYNHQNPYEAAAVNHSNNVAAPAAAAASPTQAAVTLHTA